MQRGVSVSIMRSDSKMVRQLKFRRNYILAGAGSGTYLMV